LNNRVSLPDHEITFMEVGMIKNFNPSAPEFQKYNVLQQSAFFLRKHKTQAVYQRIINEIGFFGVVNLFLQRKIEFIDLSFEVYILNDNINSLFNIDNANY